MTADNSITFGHLNQCHFLRQVFAECWATEWAENESILPHVRVHWGSCIFSYWYFEA